MLTIVTIVLNGMPFIRHHIHQLNQLKVDWKWIIAEGVAANVKDTSWCKSIKPTLSTDGTSDYLSELAKQNPNVRVLQSAIWPGKTSQINSCLDYAIKPGVLMQIDCDELWTAGQMTKIVKLFDTYPQAQRAYFWCKFHVGPKLIITSSDGYGNRNGLEWLRAWRYTPGMRFNSHEPPVLDGNRGASISRDVTGKQGLVFQHMAYVTESQVAFKEQYYGYTHALRNWKRLQSHTRFPAKLREFLPWVDGNVMVDKIAC